MNPQRGEKGLQFFLDRPFCSLQDLDIQPYMFEPESEPENEDEPPEQQQDVPVGSKCEKCGKIPAEPGSICCPQPRKKAVKKRLLLRQRKKGSKTLIDRPLCSLQDLDIQPYMFEPESEPENEDEPPEQKQDVPVGCKCETCGKIPAEPGSICCPQPGKKAGKKCLCDLLKKLEIFHERMNGDRLSETNQRSLHAAF